MILSHLPKSPSADGREIVRGSAKIIEKDK
jgi:hypothetical protein